MQASVVMVNPGGTGMPMPVISARFAPFPPSSDLSSALPSPKSYTYFLDIIRNTLLRAPAIRTDWRPRPAGGGATPLWSGYCNEYPATLGAYPGGPRSGRFLQ